MKCIHILKYLNITFALLALLFACFYSRWDLSFTAPLLQVVGNLHPLFLHLPIGGFTFLILLKITNKLGLANVDKSVLVIILLFTSLFANASFFTGFILASQGGYPSDLLNDHLWSAAAYVCFLAIAGFLLSSKKQALKISVSYYLFLMVSGVSMVLTGHFGGLMSHGDPLAPLLDEVKPVVIDKPTEERLVFDEVVKPILQAKCYDCHGNGKAKGKLTMNTIEEILKGGESDEKTLIPGDHKKSLLISSLMLPLDHDEHMPPAKKTQLTEGEIKILTWWVTQGAPSEKTVAEVAPSAQLIKAIEELVPEDIRQKREIDRLQKMTAQKQKSKEQRAVLNEKIEASIPSELRPMIRFISPRTTDIHFSSVSLQSEFTDDDFNSLRELSPHFTSLDLSHSSITSTTVKSLTSCHNLHSLRIANTSITSTDLEEIGKLQELKTLSLHTTDIDSSALTHLSSLKKLTKLYLWNTKISPEDIATFKKNNPNVNVVH